LHHGTILFSSELKDLSGALNAPPAAVNDKAVKSVRSEVTNISHYLLHPLTPEDFRNLVLRHVMTLWPDARAYQFSEADLAAINQLRDEKYATHEWNYKLCNG
jgi:lipoate-protein ligase A